MPQQITKTELFPKSTWSRDAVEHERQRRLRSKSVISSDITEDNTNWILTTVRNAP